MPLHPSAVLDQIRGALDLLLLASDYADECANEHWQFAVSLNDLYRAGATLTDVRWLIHREIAGHAKEITIAGDNARSFRPLAPTSFPADTCLALTEQGAKEVRALLRTNGELVAETKATGSSRSPGGSALNRVVNDKLATLPHWDADRRELTFDGAIVKRFRVPAANQTLILSVLEELAWPASIDDPLPPKDEVDAKERLRNTVKSLNNAHRCRLLRFCLNGIGSQICWEPLSNSRTRRLNR